MQINGIEIGGHVYNVIIDSRGNIVQNECIGRWPMSDCPTGDTWLDNQLQRAVNDRINSFDE